MDRYVRRNASGDGRPGWREPFDSNNSRRPVQLRYARFLSFTSKRFAAFSACHSLLIGGARRRCVSAPPPLSGLSVAWRDPLQEVQSAPSLAATSGPFHESP
jgi:hypothetical protein